MIELLALPDWRVLETRMSAWVGAIEGQGFVVTLVRESTGVSWLEVKSLEIRGYAVTAGENVEAINFEVGGSDPGAARGVLEVGATALGWELSVDDDDETDD